MFRIPPRPTPCWRWQEQRLAREEWWLAPGHTAGVPLAAEGVSAAPCCAAWPLRNGSRGPAGVMSHTMVWSPDRGWSQARQQLRVAFAVFGGDGSSGVAASEVTARSSASLHAYKHVYCTTKSE